MSEGILDTQNLWINLRKFLWIMEIKYKKIKHKKIK